MASANRRTANLCDNIPLIVLTVGLLPVQPRRPSPAGSQRPTVLDSSGGSRGDDVAVGLDTRGAAGDIVRCTAVDDVPRRLCVLQADDPGGMMGVSAYPWVGVINPK